MPAPSTTVSSILDWYDERGYNLSDRIWNVSEATTAQLDLVLQQGIAEGRSAKQLSSDLEQFLLPGRELRRTNTPYGSDGSFYGMRLARTEITRANSVATQIAAIANPFVTRMYYHLSAVHEGGKGDICEEYADESDANDGYTPEECPTPGVDTHPNCMCYTTMGVMSEDDATALIRDDLNAEADANVFTDDSLFDKLIDAIWGLAPAFLEWLLSE